MPALASTKSTAKKSISAKAAVKANTLKKTSKQSRTLSDTAKVIKFLLANTEEQKLSQYMSKSPSRLSEGDADTLLKLLGKLGMDITKAKEVALSSTSKRLHCVRCHKTYKEKSNGLSACVITHNDVDEDPDPCSDDGYEWERRCSSCGDVAFDEDPFDDICFKGRHTTDPDEVDYGSSTRECEEGECY